MLYSHILENIKLKDNSENEFYTQEKSDCKTAAVNYLINCTECKKLINVRQTGEPYICYTRECYLISKKFVQIQREDSTLI